MNDEYKHEVATICWDESMEEEGNSEFAVVAECPLEDVKALADESAVKKEVTSENEVEEVEVATINLENIATNGEDKDDLMLQILVVEEEWFDKIASEDEKVMKEEEVIFENFEFIYDLSSMVRVEEDVVVEDEVAVAYLYVDAACLCI